MSIMKQELFKYGSLPSTSNFFGRKQELQQIEHAFATSRIVTITGVDGQGKTSLAIEIGRRSKNKVCFIDYSAGVNLNTVDLAVKTLSDVLDDQTVAKGVVEATAALKETPVLLIFDNLETVQSEQLSTLLDVAKLWSETGECRLLITNKEVNFTDSKHIPLTGLDDKNAVEFFHYLWKLSVKTKPPKSSELLQLFKLVDFNPLLIKLLLILLQAMSPLVLKENLDTLLTAKNPTNRLWLILNFVLKSLEVSVPKTGLSYWLAKFFKSDLNRNVTINSTTLSLLPRLGVFQHGAFEPDLLEITDFTKKQWELLKSTLQTAGLIQLEKLPLFVVPYIKFHPILAQTLWSHIAEEHKKVFSDYQQRYAQVSAYMSYEEGKNADQVRNLIRRDFPNLIHAVSSALDAKATWAPQFVKNLSLYLTVFGFEQDKDFLTKRAETMQKK